MCLTSTSRPDQHSQHDRHTVLSTAVHAAIPVCYRLCENLPTLSWPFLPSSGHRFRMRRMLLTEKAQVSSQRHTVVSGSWYKQCRPPRQGSNIWSWRRWRGFQRWCSATWRPLLWLSPHQMQSLTRCCRAWEASETTVHRIIHVCKKLNTFSGQQKYQNSLSLPLRAHRVCREHGYSVQFTGVGESAGHWRDVGFCTQIAVFQRNFDGVNRSMSNAEHLEPSVYRLVRKKKTFIWDVLPLPLSLSDILHFLFIIYHSV